MRVACVIDSLGPGGAQRQLCTLAAKLRQAGWDVSVLTYHSVDPFFLPTLQAAGVVHVALTGQSRLRRALAIRRALRRGRYDVVLAFLEGATMYAELAALPTKHYGLVVSERSRGVRRVSRWGRSLHRVADYVTTNSHTNRLLIELDVPSLVGRIVTIYNAVDMDRFHPGLTSRGGARRG